ncbi:mitochondrial import receptor subunit TOM70-like [Drosophila pseudoobscura]|uniref:Mitochondrial import receptor subunit TOM70-like n=1 Tax=Drosophila pseudoobscura pseudoobscura TaxID=46245 RepID=A0A6I8UYY7_DROPS|nr:mitochondrial import receptor subunit TOM70 [Drosophila pseudoobscura]
MAMILQGLQRLTAVKLEKWQIGVICSTPFVIGLMAIGARKIIAGKSTPAQKLALSKEAMMHAAAGKNCLRNEKYKDAVLCYGKALDLCPKDQPKDMVMLLHSRAEAYEMLHKWDKVLEDCTELLAYCPHYSKAYARRAHAHEALNNIKDSLDDITACCILELFQNNHSIVFADRILQLTGRADAVEELASRAPLVPSLFCFNSYMLPFFADPLQTTNLPARSLVKTPNAFMRAHRALRARHFKEIIPACTEEIESPDSGYRFDALLMRGTFYLLSNAFKESKHDFGAIVNNPNADTTLSAYAYMRRATVNYYMNDKAAAVADFDAAEKMQPSNPDVYFQRALTLLPLDPAEALTQFKKSVTKAPRHAVAVINMHYADYRASIISGALSEKRMEGVMRNFEETIMEFPKCVECYNLMAQMLVDRQDFPKAQEYFEKALELEPSNSSVLVQHALMVMQWRGDKEMASKMLNKAIADDPHCQLAYETLGTIEVQRAHLKEAVELFDQAISCCKSYDDLTHAFALRNASQAQINVTEKLGIDIKSMNEQVQQHLSSLD